MNQGLTVVLNSTSSDYFYSLHSTIGFIVGIHNSRNYPDSTNGNYHQFVLPQNTEAFFKLDIQTIQTDEDVLRYSVEKVWHFQYAEQLILEFLLQVYICVTQYDFRKVISTESEFLRGSIFKLAMF